MSKNLVLSVLLLFVLGTALSAHEPLPNKPFSGCCLAGWKLVNSKAENCWKVGKLTATDTTMELAPLKEGETGCMVNYIEGDWHKANPRKGVDIFTAQKYGDCTVKLEFLITKGSNSGVYLMGEYEVQVADSFEKPDDKLGQGDMGAIYSAAKPSTNACNAPGTWQTYEIEFVAPKFDAAGNKTANAVFKKIVLNGKVVQENVEVEKSTGGGITGKEAATGPLMLQGNHGPVAYRNIEVIPAK